MSKLEKLSDRFLRVGRHPFRLCSRSNRDHHDQDDSKVCCCCHTDSPLYSKCWPFIFFFSAITDYPMPLPKDKKPGQHRDWSWLPVIVVSSLVTFVYYGYLDRIVCKVYLSCFCLIIVLICMQWSYYGSYSA